MAEPMKVAYVFPGQGAQWVGMGRDLYHNFDSAKAVFEQADQALAFPCRGYALRARKMSLRLPSMPSQR